MHGKNDYLHGSKDYLYGKKDHLHGRKDHLHGRKDNLHLLKRSGVWQVVLCVAGGVAATPAATQHATPAATCNLHQLSVPC